MLKTIKDFWLPLNPSYPGSFRLRETDRSPEGEGFSVVWLATAKRGSREARFRIQMLTKPPAPAGSNGFNLTMTEGAFLREPSGDNGWLLSDFAEALGATIIPEKSERLHKVEFSVAILGVGLHREGELDKPKSGKGYTTSQPGDWTVMKGFIGEHSNEFYLAVNHKLGIGEISPKDESYGNSVIVELAKVL